MGKLINPIRRVSERERQLCDTLLSQNKSDFEQAKEQAQNIINKDKEQVYILLYYSVVDEEDKSFDIEYSRLDMYKKIKDMIDMIDVKKSFVITSLKEGTSIEDAMKDATVYNFMKTFQGVYNDTDFDIDNYVEDYM